MDDKINVSMEENHMKARVRFVIDIPRSLIINSNFLEVMAAYRLIDPASWLIALANVIRNIDERNTK